MILTLIIPVYNESDAIAPFLARVRNLEFGPLLKDYRLLFVDDGSTDDTARVIQGAASEDSRISLIRLSRNFGKESALMAGLRESESDYYVPIDVDLQDPPELIPSMVEQGSRGADIVFARRASRTSDSPLYRRLTRTFRRIFGTTSGLESTADIGDYLLLNRPARDAVISFSESTLYMKGLTQWIGFTRSFVDYERGARNVGQTKFGFRKLSNLAIDGLVSFSPAPLRYLLLPGALLSLGAMSYGLFLVVRTLASGSDVPGYPSVMVAVLILGGLQLLILGILGEYISQILREVKGRPQYIVMDPKSSKDDLSKL